MWKQNSRRIIDWRPGDAAGQGQNSINNNENNNDNLLTAHTGKKWQTWKKPVFHKMCCVRDLQIT
jgi:hypothetical protein